MQDERQVGWAQICASRPGESEQDCAQYTVRSGITLTVGDWYAPAPIVGIGDGTWQTLFIDDECVESLIGSSPGLEVVMAASGDLHASAEGQDALAPSEKTLLAEPVIEIDGDHLGVMLNPESHRAILRIIREGGVDRRK